VSDFSVTAGEGEKVVRSRDSYRHAVNRFLKSFRSMPEPVRLRTTVKMCSGSSVEIVLCAAEDVFRGNS
jgi:hypothetical protein